MKLLNVGNNAKTIKSDKKGYITGILYLAPHKSGGKNVCSHASKGCIKSCLYTAGFGAYPFVQTGRINKTKLFFENREQFKEMLINDIRSLVNRAKKRKLIPLVRLNGTSDLPWETIFPEIFTMFPDVQFYCYTKVYSRYVKFQNGDFPSNYHLTFSRSETNEDKVLEILKSGGNVSVVFHKVPKTWNGFKVINGDNDDLIFLKKGLVGLKAKGRAKKDTTGFVV